jgi:hypothetical protein
VHNWKSEIRNPKPISSDFGFRSSDFFCGRLALEALNGFNAGKHVQTRQNWSDNAKRCRIQFASLLMATLQVLLGATGRAEEVKTGNSGPHAYFPEPVYDFGTVVVGHVVKHVFVLTNTGSQTLEIKDVKSTCGCTTAGAWTRTIEPGKGGTIPVEFHTDHVNGPVTKPVMVTCNDTNQPGLTLELKGVVWHPIVILPAAAAFSGVLDSPTNMYRTIRITNQEDHPLVLSEPKSNQRSIAADLVTNVPGQVYELTIRLVPPLGGGNVFGEISVPTSSTNMPVVRVPVWAIAQPAVMVLPPRVELPTGPFTNKVTRSVSVRNNGSTPLELSDLAINAQGVDAKLYELQKGQNFTVMLNFPEGFQAAKGQTFELSFKSNNPKFPLLKVPIGNP